MEHTLGFWFMLTPIILTALAVVLAISLRWFSHRERMALISRGLPLEEEQDKKKQNKTILAAGLSVSLIGLAITVGLLTLGIGPWLLAGLLILFVGLALILTSLVLKPGKTKTETQLQTNRPGPEETESQNLNDWQEEAGDF